MPTLDTDAAPAVDRGQRDDRRRSERPETDVVWLITQRQLAERGAVSSSVWGGRHAGLNLLEASPHMESKSSLLPALASDG